MSRVRDAYLRHAQYYMRILQSANELYVQGGEAISKGRALFDQEKLNIEAGQSWSAAHLDVDDEAMRLCNEYPTLGAFCLELRHSPVERIRWLRAAAHAAHRLGNRHAEASHLGNLALALRHQGEVRKAVEYHLQSLTIVREIGDRQGEGENLNNLGNAFLSLVQLQTG